MKERKQGRGSEAKHAVSQRPTSDGFETRHHGFQFKAETKILNGSQWACRFVLSSLFCVPFMGFVFLDDVDV